MRTILHRLARLVGVMILVTLTTAFMVNLSSTEPAVILAGEAATGEQIAAINAEYGFDQPTIERYFRWVGNALRGDLGESYRTHQPVLDALWQRIPVTVEIALVASLLSLIVAVPLAMLCSYRQGSRLDRLITGVSSALVSLPPFLIGLLLILLLGVTWTLLPVLGWVPITESVSGNLKAIIMPALSLAVYEMVIIQRTLRADLIHTLEQDYILQSTARGLSPLRLMLTRAMRPSSFSLITLISLSFGRLLGGTVIVEMIFVLPGIGQYLAGAVHAGDIFVVQGVVAFVALAFLAINFLVDLLYVFLDPRVRTAHG